MAKRTFGQRIKAVGIEREDQRRKRERDASAARVLTDDFSTRFARLREAVRQSFFETAAGDTELAKTYLFEIDALGDNHIQLEVTAVRGVDGTMKQPTARSYFVVEADSSKRLVSYRAVVGGKERKASHGPVDGMPDWDDLEDRVASFIESLPVEP